MSKLVQPPTILSLDMATHTGWAHSCGAGGMIALPKKVKGQSNIERFKWFMSWVEVTTLQYPTNIITYESGSHKRGGAAMYMGIGMMIAIEMICDNLDIQCLTLHTKSIKKHATGNGDASKADMIAAAKKAFTLKHYEENYVDAKWQLDYAQALWKKGELV